MPRVGRVGPVGPALHGPASRIARRRGPAAGPGASWRRRRGSTSPRPSARSTAVRRSSAARTRRCSMALPTIPASARTASSSCGAQARSVDVSWHSSWPYHASPTVTGTSRTERTPIASSTARSAGRKGPRRGRPGWCHARAPRASGPGRAASRLGARDEAGDARGGPLVAALHPRGGAPVPSRAATRQTRDTPAAVPSVSSTSPNGGGSRPGSSRSAARATASRRACSRCGSCLLVTSDSPPPVRPSRTARSDKYCYTPTVGQAQAP